jgi:hypothetical protein
MSELGEQEFIYVDWANAKEKEHKMAVVSAG